MSRRARVPRRLWLHDHQAEVHNHPARFKTVVAGRRFGKGELAVTTLLLGGPGRKPGDPRRGCLNDDGVYRYIAPTQKLARRTFWRRKLRRALDPSWLARPPNETNLEIEFTTGAILEILGADDPDSLRGEGVSGVVIDEFDDVKPPTWPEAVRPSLADMNGWGMLLGTPKSFTQLYDFYQRGQSPQFPEWMSWQFKSIDNPLLDRKEIEEARRTTDPRTFRQEWEASFETIGGRAYYAFDRKHHVRPVVLAPGLPIALSFDFNVDPATAIIGQRIRDEFHVWREVWLTHRGGEATRASAREAKEHLGLMASTFQLAIYGDPSGKSAKTTGPSDHAVLREMFPNSMFRIRTGQPHIKDRVEAVNSRCQTADGVRHLVVDPHCEHLIADLEQVTMEDLTTANTPYGKTHLSDCLAYVCEYEWPPRGGTAVAALPGLRI